MTTPATRLQEIESRWKNPDPHGLIGQDIAYLLAELTALRAELEQVKQERDRQQANATMIALSQQSVMHHAVARAECAEAARDMWIGEVEAQKILLGRAEAALVALRQQIAGLRDEMQATYDDERRREGAWSDGVAYLARLARVKLSALLPDERPTPPRRTDGEARSDQP